MGSIEPNAFDCLSDELVLEILERAKEIDVLNCRKLCKRFRDLSYDNVLWRRLYAREFSLSRGLHLMNRDHSSQGDSGIDYPPAKASIAKIDWVEEYKFNYRWSHGKCWTRKKQLSMTRSAGASILRMETYRGYTFSVIDRSVAPERHLQWGLQAWDAKTDSEFTEVPFQPSPQTINGPDVPIGILIDRHDPSSEIIRLAVLWTSTYAQFYEFVPRTFALSYASSLLPPEGETIETLVWKSKKNEYSHYEHPYFGTMRELAHDENYTERRPIEILTYIFNSGRWHDLRTIDFPGGIPVNSPFHVCYDSTNKELVVFAVWTDNTRNTDPRMVAAREWQISEDGRLLRESTTVKEFNISAPENTDPVHLSFHYAHPYGAFNGAPIVMFKVEPSTAESPLAINLVGIAYKSTPKKDGRGLASAAKLELDSNGRMITCGIIGTRMRVYQHDNGYLTSTPYTPNPIFRLKSRYVRYFDGVDVAQFEDQQENEHLLDLGVKSRRDKCVRMRRHDPRYLYDIRFDSERLMLLYRVNTVAHRGFVFYVQIFDFDKQRTSEKIRSMNWEDFWERPAADLSKKWGSKRALSAE